MCAGFDGIPHQAYIYKQIDGKKYCKSCAYKLKPPKSIKKVSEKQKFKLKLKSQLLEEDKEFYIRVWYKRFGRVHGTAEKYGVDIDNTQLVPKCESCGKRLYFQPNLVNFHHVLEKRNFPEYRHDEDNIAVVCPECHSSYETNPDTVPEMKKRRKAVIEKMMNKLIEDIENNSKILKQK